MGLTQCYSILPRVELNIMDLRYLIEAGIKPMYYGSTTTDTPFFNSTASTHKNIRFFFPSPTLAVVWQYDTTMYRPPKIKNRMSMPLSKVYVWLLHHKLEMTRVVLLVGGGGVRSLRAFLPVCVLLILAAGVANWTEIVAASANTNNKNQASKDSSPTQRAYDYKSLRG